MVERITVLDIVGGLIVAGLFALLHFVLGISGDSLFFWPFIAAVIYWNLDARVSFGFALVTLVVIPVLLILFNKEILLTGEYWAERVAVWTYYFLVIGMLKQIVEYVQERRKKKKWSQNMLEAKRKKREAKRAAIRVTDIVHVAKIEKRNI
jgi:hypothetical protein